MERFYPRLKDSEKLNILDSFKDELTELKINTSKVFEEPYYLEEEDLEPDEVVTEEEE